MPERKSHVKSRLGCTQCKSRRVKCNEERPQCGNCRRRQEHCSYTDPRPIATPSPDTAASAANSGLEAQASYAVKQAHLKQLELMHQYSTSTWRTLSIRPELLRAHGDDVYQVQVPRLALHHDFLLDTIFALASLHLAYLRPKESRLYIADAARYHTRALASCRQTLQNFSASEVLAMYYCSAKLGTCALAFRTIDPDTAKADKPSETLAQLAGLWHGTWSIIRASEELMDPVTHDMFFPAPNWDMRNGSEIGSQAHGYIDQLRQKVRSRSFPATPHDDSPSPIAGSNAIFLDTIDQLQTLLDAVDLEHSRVLAWVVLVPPPFMEAFSQGELLASAIVLLYSVAFQEMDQYWWSSTFRQDLVDELAPVVAGGDPDLVEMVDWVRSWSRPHQRPAELIPLVTSGHEMDLTFLASAVESNEGTHNTTMTPGSSIAESHDHSAV